MTSSVATRLSGEWVQVCAMLGVDLIRLLVLPLIGDGSFSTLRCRPFDMWVENRHLQVQVVLALSVVRHAFALNAQY